MQDDGPRLEEHKAILFEDRHLTERLQRAVFRLVLIALFQKARAIGEAGFFERPAHAKILHLAPGEIRNPFES